MDALILARVTSKKIEKHLKYVAIFCYGLDYRIRNRSSDLTKKTVQRSPIQFVNKTRKFFKSETHIDSIVIFFFSKYYQFIEVYRTASYHLIANFFFQTISECPRLFSE